MCGSRFSIISSSSFLVAMVMFAEAGAVASGVPSSPSGPSLFPEPCSSSTSRSISGRGVLQKWKELYNSWSRGAESCALAPTSNREADLQVPGFLSSSLLAASWWGSEDKGQGNELSPGGFLGLSAPMSGSSAPSSLTLELKTVGSVGTSSSLICASSGTSSPLVLLLCYLGKRKWKYKNNYWKKKKQWKILHKAFRQVLKMTNYPHKFSSLFRLLIMLLFPSVVLCSEM